MKTLCLNLSTLMASTMLATVNGGSQNVVVTKSKKSLSQSIPTVFGNVEVNVEDGDSCQSPVSYEGLVRSLNPFTRKRFEHPQAITGVLIPAVMSNSPMISINFSVIVHAQIASIIANHTCVSGCVSPTQFIETDGSNIELLALLDGDAVPGIGTKNFAHPVLAWRLEFTASATTVTETFQVLYAAGERLAEFTMTPTTGCPSAIVYITLGDLSSGIYESNGSIIVGHELSLSLGDMNNETTLDLSATTWTVKAVPVFAIPENLNALRPTYTGATFVK
jgi:hypothetical protein